MFEDQYKTNVTEHTNTVQLSMLTYSRVSHPLLCSGRLLFGNASERMECICVCVYACPSLHIFL